MADQKVYHPGRKGYISALISLPITTFFFLFGLGGLFFAEDKGWWCFCIPAVLLGGAGVAGTCTMHTLRMVVDHEGITQTSCLRYRLHVSWDAIEAWLAAPAVVKLELEREVWKKLYPHWRVYWPKSSPLDISSYTGQVMLFRLRGRSDLFPIDNFADWQPSFSEFVADVRARIPDKEIVIPESQLECEKSHIADRNTDRVP